MKVFIDQVVVNGEIKGDLYIESDSMQYMINLHTGARTDDKGKVTDVYTNKGYYGTLAQAVKGIVKMKIAESQATTLSQLIADIAYIESYIDSKIAN